MATTRDNVITLAQTIGNFSGSTITLGRAFDEVVENLCKLDQPPFVYSSGLAVTTTSAHFSRPSSCVKVLAVFFEKKQLYQVDKHELENWNIAWRGSTAGPLAYYIDEDDPESVRFIPAPTTATTGKWIYTKSPSEIPDYMVLYVTFAMLEREYAYPSSKQDKEFSTLCGKIAELFAKMIGF